MKRLLVIVCLVAVCLSACENKSTIEENGLNTENLEKVDSTKEIEKAIDVPIDEEQNNGSDMQIPPNEPIGYDDYLHDDGYIYEIEQKFDFELSSLTVHRIKVYDEGFYNVFLMEYTVQNKTDEEVRWKFDKSGNICGKIVCDTYDVVSPDTKRRFSSNTQLGDEDIDCDLFEAEHLQANESIHAAVNFLIQREFLWTETEDDYEAVLMKDEPMRLIMDYVENGKNYTYEILLNQ